MTMDRKNLYWNKIDNLIQNDNIFVFRKPIQFQWQKQVKEETETMYSKEKLEQLRQIASIRSLTQEELAVLFNQVIGQQQTIEKWYGLLSLISRSGSSWSSRIREALNEFHFGTIDPATIDAAKTLLQKHTGKAVTDVLSLLERMDAPINRKTR